MKTNVWLLLLTLLVSLTAFADRKSGKSYTTARVQGEAPAIDGLLDDAAWNNVSWSGEFVQREPNEGEQPSQRTAFKMLYDNDNLYIAVRMYDTEPDKIVRRMSRRDGFEGDWVKVFIDSYNDKRTAFAFTASVSGVKSDEYVSNDGDNWDDTWDPIWYVNTSVDNEGWVAEMRIPLDQLRFSNNDEHSWGINVVRYLFRSQERSMWQLIKHDDPGWVSNFGNLEGISNIHPKRQIQLIPYTLGKLELSPAEQGNPFATGSRWGGSVGLDGKIGLTNDFTLDLTINPDFGQVEADPSEVNLTAFETFLQEKRPFFIEGKNILSFKFTGGDGPMAGDNLFYSRRIGRAPQGFPSLAAGEYYDMPQNTSILGALKLSGKTKDGWSVGVLESVTNAEKARIDNEGQRRTEVVEPLTNYFVSSVQKDLNGGNTVIGGMITSANRKIDNPNLDWLHTNANTGGINLLHQWNEKSNFVRVNLAGSNVNGSKNAILNTQMAPQRYYQRPDAEHVEIDTNRTSLQGLSGGVEMGKIGNGHWNYMGYVTFRTPGFETNDIGYMRRADEIQQVLWVGYRVWKPFSIFNRININMNQWTGFNFEGLNLYKGGNFGFNTQFKNYWFFSTGMNYEGSGYSTSDLWGGPALRIPQQINNWWYIGTDQRKKLTFEVNNFNVWMDQKAQSSHNLGISVNYRPVNFVDVSFSPNYYTAINTTQFVTPVEFQNKEQYIVATIDQKVLGFSFRVNWNITPDLTVQYYGQPFIASGNYTNFKRITDPRAENQADLYRAIANNEISYDADNGVYNVDENMDSSIDYQVGNPNFNFRQFMSNLVLRWEYLPGSTFYAVWSQGRTGSDGIGKFDYVGDMSTLFKNDKPSNVFLLKFSYRIKV